MKVIDVSHHNNVTDWKKVANDGVEGVIIRAGYGRVTTQKDTQFEANYAGALKAGLHIGAYWYSYATSAEDAVHEADAFIRCIKGKKFDMPLYFDIEDKKQQPLSRDTCTAIAGAFLMKLEKSGYLPGLYSYDSFFATNLSRELQNKYHIWVANFKDAVPKNVSFWGMHQYSCTGRINGISGNVDMDNCVFNYPEFIKEHGFNGYSASMP